MQKEGGKEGQDEAEADGQGLSAFGQEYNEDERKYSTRKRIHDK